MSLERKAIRRAAVAFLRGRTHAGNQVKETDSDPFRPSTAVPVSLGVYTLLDTIDDEASIDSPRYYVRDLELAVEVWVEESTTGQKRAALLDDVADQVERCIAAMVPRLERVEVCGQPLEINRSRTRLDRVELGFDRAGRSLLGSARVVFSIRYGAPARPFDCGDVVDLDTLGVGWDFAPPDAVLDARDEIPVPQD